MSRNLAMHAGSTARTTLDAWLAQGADRLDPVGFHFMVALERRTAAQSGEARHLLNQRLSQLIAIYAEALERKPCEVKHDDDPQTPPTPPSGALANLVNDLKRRSIAHSERPRENNAAASAGMPELEALDDFRALWSKIRSESQLRHSLAVAPANAGPLNSGSLVRRSLTLMRELSPGYLQHFLSYVDSLSWLEQMNHGSIVTGKKTSRAGSTSKRKRSKPA